MLILSRRVGQKIIINEDIEIIIVGCNPKYVRIGVEAPKDTMVDREEIYHKRREEKEKV